MDAELEHIKATFSNGVLTISIPKKTELNNIKKFENTKEIPIE